MAWTHQPRQKGVVGESRISFAMPNAATSNVGTCASIPLLSIGGIDHCLASRAF